MAKNSDLVRDEDLGLMLEAFFNRISHPRGRALAFMSEASVTVAQAILMSHAVGGGTPTKLAVAMNLSPSSISQMIERLVKLGFLQRSEDTEDRRRKTVRATPKAKAFLDKLRILRAEEFAAGAAVLSRETQGVLRSAVGRALRELRLRPSISNEANNAQSSGKAGMRPQARAQR